jgi:hypothetical protein
VEPVYGKKKANRVLARSWKIAELSAVEIGAALNALDAMD